MTANTENTAAKPDFDKLIEEIAGKATDVSKALPAGDKAGDGKIAAAAAEGKADADADEEAEEEDDEVGKSFEVTFEDGTKGTAVDGTALFKALSERAEKAETALGNVWTVVKSLQAEVATLRAAPKPRKSVVHINEKPAATEVSKANDTGMDPSTFLAKALEANLAGKVSGVELTKAENAINKGAQPDADFVRRVLA